MPEPSREGAASDEGNHLVRLGPFVEACRAVVVTEGRKETDGVPCIFDALVS